MITQATRSMETQATPTAAPSPLVRELQDACATGNAQDVQSVLDRLTHEESAAEDVVNTPNRLGVTPLLAACQRLSSGDSLAIVRTLLQAGARLDAVIRDGSSALHLACSRGHLSVVNLLLEHGADADARDRSKRSVLHAAVKQGDIEIVERLVRHGADVHAVDKFARSLLHVAVQRKSVPCIKLLVAEGVSVNAADSDGWTLVHSAVMTGQVEVIKLLVREGADLNVTDEKGNSPLFLAVVNNASAEVIECLVKHGADVNTTDLDGKTLLHFVVEHGSMETMELLVENGARVNASDKSGKSLLHVAAERGSEEALRFLLSKDVDLNAVDQVETKSVLHVAVSQGKREIVEFLVRKGVDVSAVDKDGKSLLHAAVENLSKTGDSVDILAFLIQSGVDVNSVDSRGRTPLHAACYLDRFTEAVRFLCSNGATDAFTVEDEDGFCPLHIAAQNLNVALVEILLDAGADVSAHCRGGETPLGIAFFVYNTDCDQAYPVAYALCSRGAEWDTSCDERLSEGRTRARDALEEVKQKDSEAAVEELQKELREELKWRLGLRVCVEYWMNERRKSVQRLTEVPVEEIKRGKDAVRIFLSNMEETAADEVVYRRKICVVGPGEWGKTSLVKSLTSMQPSLVHKDDRTIGIDLMPCQFQHTIEVEGSPPVVRQHEVTFWDFAGQDIYQVAHSLFYSKRTLYLICIDLEAYDRVMREAQAHPSMRQGEAIIARFVRHHVFRWVRSIFARQPDAEFVVVGTKSDQLPQTTLASEIWRDLRSRLSDWQTKFVAELEDEYRVAKDSLSSPSAKSFAFLRAGKTDVLAQMDALKRKVIHTVSDEWLVVSNAERDSVLSARQALEQHLTLHDRGYPMSRKYQLVLAEIMKRRQEARAMENPKDRIEHTILPRTALFRFLLRDVEDLEPDDCASIMHTLHDLGDVLWYEREGAGALQGYVIIDPTLVLDFVREVINHKRVRIQAEDEKLAGRVSHAALSNFPLWSDLGDDKELLHAFKLLLLYFQLAYPADGKEMDWDSDLIVPTYWKARTNTAEDTATEASFLKRHSFSESDAEHMICWEYELSNEVSETVFEHFAVQSHSATFDRTVRANCIESFVVGEFASRIELCQDESGTRDRIRIRVIAHEKPDEDTAWLGMRYFVMTMEKVLDAYPGLTASRYIVDLNEKSNGERHRICKAVKALVDAASMGRDEDSVRELMPWLPPDLGWYIEKAWRRPGVLQELRTRNLMRKVHSKVDVLKRLVVASDAQRRYPALWTLEIKPEAPKKAVLRMLSDLSGQCCHEPIEFDLPPQFLAKYASFLQVGLSVCSNVVPNVLSLGILKKVTELVVSAANSHIERSVQAHNLIDKLDIPASGGIFTSKAQETLSPQGSLALLRDLLKLHDADFNELTISEVSGLQCAATPSGHYIWASRQEIMAMGDKLTPCDPEHDAALESNASPLPPSPPPSQSRRSTLLLRSSLPPPSVADEWSLRLAINVITGLAAWDWRKAYCNWRLVHANSATPLASGTTSQHLDDAVAPSWATVGFSISSRTIESITTLRECRLVVDVKRPSRLLGMIKVIGSGAIALSDVLEDDAEHHFRCGRIVIPLDERATKSQRSVECQLEAM